MKTYAGIGSRETPYKILCLMEKVATWLAKQSWILSTGAATGADQAFAMGAHYGDGKVNLHIPWASYEKAWVKYITADPNVSIFVLHSDDKAAFKSVIDFHPVLQHLSRAVRSLHARNYNIVKDAAFVLCWTKDGKDSGGTGQGLRIARSKGIEIMNLYFPEVRQRILSKIGE